MGLHGYSARRDSNESDIIDTLRAAGCTVKALSAKSIPDLLVGYNGANYLLEVKMPKNDLTDDQITFFETWEGQCVVVRTPEEALKAVGLL